MKVTAEQYGNICDVVYRACPHNGLSMAAGLTLAGDDDPYLHTSEVARRATNLILDILGLEVEDPREVSR